MPLSMAIDLDTVLVYAKFKVLRQVTGKLNEMLQDCSSIFSGCDVHNCFLYVRCVGYLVIFDNLPIK